MKFHCRLAENGIVSMGIAAIFAGFAATNYAQTPSAPPSYESGAAAVFNRVAEDQSRLRVFIQAMPKGANLHNHLDGSVYTESYVKLAAEHGFCADFTTARITPPPCRTPEDELKGIDKEARNFVNEEVAAADAMAAPEPTPKILFEDIYVPGSEPQFIRGRTTDEAFYFN